MAEMTIIVDELTNQILLEGPDHVPGEVVALLTALLGPAQELGCARPLGLLSPPAATAEEIAASPCVRIAGYYHNSLVEGPGRRSSVLFQSCPLGCSQCWVPQLHSSDAGALVPVDRLAAVLLDPAYERDGVSIAGGEPFVQPEGLWALIQVLRARGCVHILVYSGYTYERLQRMAGQQPAIGAILDEVNVLVDGPYVRTLADRGGPWTGSGNQRVIDLVATRRAGRVILLVTRPQDRDRALVENAVDEAGVPNVTIRRDGTFHS
ncbi:MAG TPA: 4Fe-4S single cluster domain-containing protein [Chloroflexota bacterium]|nr:4Fe-4S single cluster domain-containing protein [Chloroflexota bacterium]